MPIEIGSRKFSLGPVGSILALLVLIFCAVATFFSMTVTPLHQLWLIALLALAIIL